LIAHNYSATTKISQGTGFLSSHQTATFQLSPKIGWGTSGSSLPQAGAKTEGRADKERIAVCLKPGTKARSVVLTLDLSH